jgi:hypothetical protein
VNRGRPLPPGIEERLASLGAALESCPGLLFAYLFGGVARRHRFESLEARKAADFRVFERRLLERRFGHGGA